MRVGDLDLHVEERGQGPPLLLIPGIPAVASDWGPLAKRLSPGRRMIAYDNRGSGQSTVTPGPYTTAQLAADAGALLDALGVDRADVMGMSLGGMVAQELAIRHPQRVRRLVLACTHAGVRHAASQPHATARAFAMRTADWGERMRTLAPFAFAPGVDPAFLEAFIAKKARDVQDPDGYEAQIAAALAHDTYDRLDRIAAPTLILTGDQDLVIPGASSRALHERIPHAELVEVPHAGHLFFIERPDESARLVERFLAA
jgi:pimeloyl-ACP methyl ester carboxylesterase